VTHMGRAGANRCGSETLPRFYRHPKRGRIVKSEMIMPARIRRRYTEEYKREAVRMVRESIHPVTQVCWDLGTPDNVLHPWTSQPPAGRGPRNHKGRGALLLRGAAEKAVPWKIGWMQNGTS
jgi:transposase-like protein